MGKHTPGPWYVSQSPSSQGRHIYAEQTVGDGEEEWEPLIAITDDDETHVDWQANAILIATAPELLAALETLLEAADRGVITEGDCAQARAAIATAKGE